MRVGLAMSVVLLLWGCANSNDDGLAAFTRCVTSAACPAGQTCLVDRCVSDGSLGPGDTCSEEPQCGPALTCYNQRCRPGCSRFYQVDDCPEGAWCAPKPEADPPIGECAESQCNPLVSSFCDDHWACVAFADRVGACLPYCEYGFVGGAYHDTCVDQPSVDLACQPLGLNFTPVCMPKSGPDGPAEGEAGCHILASPCRAGFACLDVVCRKLCLPGGEAVCGGGEICSSLNVLSSAGYCRAD